MFSSHAGWCTYTPCIPWLRLCLTHIFHDEWHWLDVPQCITFKLCITVYKCLHGLAPQYFSELCMPVTDIAGHRQLCSASWGFLQCESNKVASPKTFLRYFYLWRTCVTENYRGYCPNIFLYLHYFWSICLNICMNCIIFTSKTLKF